MVKSLYSIYGKCLFKCTGNIPIIKVLFFMILNILLSWKFIWQVVTFCNTVPPDQIGLPAFCTLCLRLS